MVDQPAPKEAPRVATNLLLRAALLLAPDQASRDYLTGIVTAGRKLAKKVSEADEESIIRSLVVALDQGVTHGAWQRD
jgi:hypothetical protein